MKSVLIVLAFVLINGEPINTLKSNHDYGSEAECSAATSRFKTDYEKVYGARVIITQITDGWKVRVDDRITEARCVDENSVLPKAVSRHI